MKNTERLSEIALAAEALLARLEHPTVEGFEVNPWGVTIRTRSRTGGIEYEETTWTDYIVATAWEEERDIEFKLVHVEHGKVIRNEPDAG